LQFDAAPTGVDDCPDKALSGSHYALRLVSSKNTS
jgi:hypothetical protein